LVNDQGVRFECDTGASVTLIPCDVYDAIARRKLLRPATGLHLKTWSGDDIPLLGKALVKVVKGEMSYHLPVYVASGCDIPLLGRDWFRRLGFAVVDKASRPIIDRLEPPAPISSIQSVSRRIADSYASQYVCSRPGPGRYTGLPVSLLLDPSVPPVKLKPRPLPFAKRERVQRQIEAMEKDGILTKIRYSPWQTPLVAIEKKGGSFRLCADYS